MPETRPSTQLALVTGLSGSGKTIALRQLEDSGYYCLDNLPAQFLVNVVRTLQSQGTDRIAVAIDARGLSGKAAIDDLKNQLEQLRQDGFDIRALFLTASTEDLVRRFSETRRRHPFSPAGGTDTVEVTLKEAIAREREFLSPIQDCAHILDSTGLKPNVLRDWVKQFVNAPRNNLTLSFESFGFKHGIPHAADLVFDVRNLPNPHYIPQIRAYTGRDKPIADYFAQHPEVFEMIDDIERFLRKWLPSYEAQNRHYLTIAIGCTGGKHRSVFCAETLARRFCVDIPGILVRHREIDGNKAG